MPDVKFASSLFVADEEVLPHVPADCLTSLNRSSLTPIFGFVTLAVAVQPDA